MVFSGEEEKENNNNMAMNSERVMKPLHNFNIPFLSWGNQRYLRCKKLQDGSSTSSDTSKELASNNATETEKGRNRINGDDGIDAVREKLILDLKTETDRMKDAILRKGEENEEDETVVGGDGSVAAAAGEGTWKLRPRKGLKIDEKKPNLLGLRNVNGGGVKLRGSPEKVKFSLTLTKTEIEEDYMKMLGHRPPRRPRKRPRNVQRQIDTLFPGAFLSEVSADSYKVPEAPKNNGKK